MEYKEMRPRRTRKKNTNKNNKAAVIVIGVLILFRRIYNNECVLHGKDPLFRKQGWRNINGGR